MTNEGRARKPGVYADSALLRGPRSRRRRPVALAALALGSSAALFFGWREPGSRRAEAPAPRALQAAASPTATAPASHPEPARPVARPSPIESIDVEKAEVCEGEENLVTVHFKAEADDPARRVLVGQAPGARVPLRRWLSAEGALEPVEVVAFGASGASYVTPVPSYRVRRCAPGPVATIETRALPNAVDAYELSASVVGPGAEGGSIRAVRWAYGDGERGRSDSATTTHSYARREQRDDYSYMLVEAEIELSNGRRARARTSVELANLAARSRRRGVTLLQSEGEPRVPSIGPDGVVEQRVKLWHAEGGVVELDRITITTVEERSGRQSSTKREAKASEIFGATRVPSGEGLVASLRLDTRARPDLVYETYELRGHDAAGRPAFGSVSVMVPTRPPSPTHGRPITSTALTGRIVRAQRLLGKPYVSRRELETLEREGAFADLAAEGEKAGASR